MIGKCYRSETANVKRMQSWLSFYPSSACGPLVLNMFVFLVAFTPRLAPFSALSRMSGGAKDERSSDVVQGSLQVKSLSYKSQLIMPYCGA